MHFRNANCTSGECNQNLKTFVSFKLPKECKHRDLQAETHGWEHVKAHTSNLLSQELANPVDSRDNFFALRPIGPTTFQLISSYCCSYAMQKC